MSYTVDQVIKIAKAEVGYLEKASNSMLDSKTANAGNKNYTKYATAYKAVIVFAAAVISFAAGFFFTKKSRKAADR